MSTSSAQDFRRAAEAALLDGIRRQQPLALAEAYHRVVPAAHAVARRLVTEASEVEEVLLDVFTQLWTDPPEATALEGWARRATWAACAERLRRDGRAPASPSASVLLPDLPAPEVRFLDASERAISELADEERRALLLAHDKGVPTTAQDPGADLALARALMSLAGPESSSGDRDAIEDDPCNDLTALGDWCLGLSDESTTARVEEVIAERTGCAARSRTVRRGRRRIEGLPATPDMGHRVLVSVLTGATAGAAAITSPAADPQPTTGPSEVGADDTGEIIPLAAGVADLRSDDDAIADPAQADDAGLTADTAGADDADDPFAALEPADVTAGDGAGLGLAEAEDAGADLFGEEGDDPFAALGAADAPAEDLPSASPDAVTADLPQSGVDSSGDDLVGGGAAGSDHEAAGPDGDDDPFGEDDAAPFGDDSDGNWAPNPGDTAELKLSDILAEDDEDDPFAALDEPAPPVAQAGGGATSNSPYAALSDLEADPAPAEASPFSGTGALPEAGTPVRAGTGPLGDPHEVYVEGQDVPLDEPVRSGGGFAALLAWVLPVLGGLAVGVLLAMQVFG